MINVGLTGLLVDGDVQGGDAAAGGKRGGDVSKEAEKKRSRGSCGTWMVSAAQSLTGTLPISLLSLPASLYAPHTCTHRHTTNATFTHSEVL